MKVFGGSDFKKKRKRKEGGRIYEKVGVGGGVKEKKGEKWRGYTPCDMYVVYMTHICILAPFLTVTGLHFHHHFVNTLVNNYYLVVLTHHLKLYKRARAQYIRTHIMQCLHHCYFNIDISTLNWERGF